MVNNMSRIRDYSLSGEERKTRLRVCIFDAAGVKSAFALLLTKVTKHDRHIWRFKMKERRFIEEDN